MDVGVQPNYGCRNVDQLRLYECNVGVYGLVMTVEVKPSYGYRTVAQFWMQECRLVMVVGVQSSYGCRSVVQLQLQECSLVTDILQGCLLVMDVGVQTSYDCKSVVQEYILVMALRSVDQVRFCSILVEQGTGLAGPTWAQLGLRKAGLSIQVLSTYI